MQKKFFKETYDVEVVSDYTVDDLIIDIRSIYDYKNKPLEISGMKVISLPFYRINEELSNLDRNKNWLLWCEHGIMSKLQAINLRSKGYFNVKVYINKTHH